MSSKRKLVEYPSKIDITLKTSKSEFAITTNKDDIQLPAVIVFSGSRGSGKTYACITLMRHFEIKHYINRTFLLCPTRESNDLYSNLRTLRPQDSYTNENQFRDALVVIMKTVKEDWRKYRLEKEYAIVYHKWRRLQYSLNVEEEMMLERRNREPPQRIPKPSHLLIVDDAQGTDLYSNARKDILSHMIIKHRHIPITVALLAQSWTGIPRVIRLNTTHFAVYKTGDRTQLKQIYDTFANSIAFDRFEQLYKTAVSKPHGFLFIDTIPKKESRRFRSGFNEFLV